MSLWEINIFKFVNGGETYYTIGTEENPYLGRDGRWNHENLKDLALPLYNRDIKLINKVPDKLRDVIIQAENERYHHCYYYLPLSDKEMRKLQKLIEDKYNVFGK